MWWIFIPLWILSGIVCIALDILTAGKTSTGAVVVQVVLGPIALVAFVIYLLVAVIGDYIAESSDSTRHNWLALGIFTIIAIVASFVYNVWIR